MKKTAMFLYCIPFILVFSVYAMAEQDQCTTIQDGTLLTSTGDVIVPGFDRFGYNYQAHMFNGRYCDFDRVEGGPYCDINLIMKWNDAWLSNKDCDGDSKLDRHYGYDFYKGSGAWLTNHQSGTYEGDNGKMCKWVYFVKIVAVPADAVLSGGVWYTAGGVEIGPVEWGEFAIIESVNNDPCGGAHGIEYLSPDHAGLGNW
jgi:hypothetical protein